MSIPRIRSEASKLRRCGRYPIRSPAPPGRRPSTDTVPFAEDKVPSSTLIKVDLPTPFGPSTATNSPLCTVRFTPLHSVRPPTTADAPRSATTVSDSALAPKPEPAATGSTLIALTPLAGAALLVMLLMTAPFISMAVSPSTRAGQRALQLLELVQLPLLEAVARGEKGLGHRGHRDTFRLGLGDLRCDIRCRILRVVHVDLDRLALDLLVDQGFVGRRRVVALAYVTQERVRRQHLESQSVGEP